MPTFDIVSKIELPEVDNAVNGVLREIEVRYDFKGSKATLEWDKETLTILADDDMKLRQMQELVRGHFAKRKIEAGSLDFQKAEPAAGQSVRQKILLRQGIDRDAAKTITKAIKDAKLKVQVQIQGDELRVTGKKRDDLQDAIAVCKALPMEQPLQYVNFRD
ncbi:YajQ family cyclic di-GMP-binding protein [Oceanibacterium hippocampi]|uniref:Nucleotide-binding protein OCH7691_03230 n=1 Tax=Oceanibacterium hippocampi TaxID=745714 RepID=A0A1Y5TQI0_9PROT|nr:YajQ family cyclic di-GMP-binding protein [Oceanibacterium hippocampi]SLN69753.1 putative nucleotide-binding protein [Oceanibacterium hippocampi]